MLTGTSATITCTVTDSRGYTATGTVSVTLYPYKKPALSDVALYRADEDGTANRAGLCIYARAKLTWSDIGGRNPCSLTGYFRLQSGSYPSAGTDMTSGTGILLTNAAAVTSTYVAKIEAKDSLGNTASYEATIPTDNVAFHIREGGQGAGFGKYAEEDDLLDVAWNALVRKNMTVSGSLLLNKEAKAMMLSQTGDAGSLILNTITEYPTRAGIYRVGVPVAGLPNDTNGYGCLLIFNGGSYVSHLYIDNYGALYTAMNGTNGDNMTVNAPTIWQKYAYTSVTAKT